MYDLKMLERSSLFLWSLLNFSLLFFGWTRRSLEKSPQRRYYVVFSPLFGFEVFFLIGSCITFTIYFQRSSAGWTFYWNRLQGTVRWLLGWLNMVKDDGKDDERGWCFVDGSFCMWETVSHKVQVLLATAKRRDQKCRISERIWVIHKYHLFNWCFSRHFNSASCLLDSLGFSWYLGRFCQVWKTTVDS